MTTIKIEVYRAKTPQFEAWQWLGQPESEWPEWLGPLRQMLHTLEHGWYFVRQPHADRASAHTKEQFEQDNELVLQVKS